VLVPALRAPVHRSLMGDAHGDALLADGAHGLVRLRVDALGVRSPRVRSLAAVRAELHRLKRRPEGGRVLPWGSSRRSPLNQSRKPHGARGSLGLLGASGGAEAAEERARAHGDWTVCALRYIQHMERIALGMIGVGMIVVAGALDMGEAVRVAFVGAGFVAVVVAVLLGRLAPGHPQEISLQGVKLVLRDLSDAARERNEPETAQVLERAADAVQQNGWFEEYLSSPAARHPDPYVQAAGLEAAYKNRGD
jgi:hypothetical protein